jgi:hypothetical protein
MPQAASEPGAMAGGEAADVVMLVQAVSNRRIISNDSTGVELKRGLDP